MGIVAPHLIISFPVKDIWRITHYGTAYIDPFPVQWLFLGCSLCFFCALYLCHCNPTSCAKLVPASSVPTSKVCANVCPRSANVARVFRLTPGRIGRP